MSEDNTNLTTTKPMTDLHLTEASTDLVSKSNEPSDTVQEGGELITKKDQKSIQYWYDEIIKDYKSSVECIVRMGKSIAAAKVSLGSSFRELEKMLPFSHTIASYFVTISKNKFLSNPDSWVLFPAKYNTLYEFAKLPDLIQEEKMKNKEISPQVTAKVIKSWNPKIKKNKKDKANNFVGKGGEKLYPVGMISIAEPENLDAFQQELNSLIEKYNGRKIYLQSDGSLAKWHIGKMLERADKKIAETADGLGKKHTIEQVRILDTVVKYLETPRNKKQEVEVAGNKEKSGLPLTHDYYETVAKLIGRREVTIANIADWCVSNKFPSRTVKPEMIDKEVYVWELLRQVAESHNPDKEIGYLKSIAETNPNESIKNTAREAWADAIKFQNT